MPTFSVAILTSAPPGRPAEAGGAFVKIGGREALLRSVELFLNRDSIRQIQVVVMPDDLEKSRRKYGPHLSFSGVKLISGGPTWRDQSAAAGQKLEADVTHVIVHDAARPLVPASDVTALLEAADGSDVAALTAPMRSELIQVDDGGRPLHHWRADEFVQLLTPQLYSRERFNAMTAGGEHMPLAHARLIKGSPLNVRIRGGGDASLGNLILGLLPKPKVKPPSNPFEEAQW